MKTGFLAIICIAISIAGCKKTSQTEMSAIQDETTIPTVGRKCATQEVLARQLREDPSLADRMNRIEAYLQNAQRDLSGRLVNGTYEIPVVVNVLYNTSAQNISDAQINSQITVLNKDYSGRNSEYNTVPTAFKSVRAFDTKNILCLITFIENKPLNQAGVLMML